jgi:DNA polymerase-3 subunit delta
VIKLNNIYVFYGDEKYLIDQEIEKICKSLIGEDYQDIVSKYNLNQVDIATILEDANMISMWSSKKMIICYNSSFLTSSSKEESLEQDVDLLINYLDNSNENTTIIFTVENNKLDERKRVVKELRKKAIVKEFNKLKEEDLSLYAKSLFENNNYKIDKKAIQILTDRIEGDLGFLNQEINKLMLYKEDTKEITIEDIEELVRIPITDDVFKLVDAVLNKNLEKSLTIYQQLLLRNEEPIKIVIILANQFRLIYQTKKLYKKGYSEKDIASKLGIHPYRIKLAGLLKIEEEQLLNYIEKLADLDEDIKMGRTNKDIGLELFLLQIK